MKKFKVLFTGVLIILLACASQTFVFAGNGKSNGHKETTQIQKNNEDAGKEDNGNQKPWKVTKGALQEEKADIVVQKAQIESKLEELENQYKLAEASGDTALMETLMSQIQQLREEKDSYQNQMKQKIKEKQELMKQRYTQEELNALDKVGKELCKDTKIKVLPVTNVFMKDGELKFDTPPVIKEGRTLLPLRAISAATGAKVDWDPETKKVTISKGEDEIVFLLNEGKIYVNQVETSIDVPAEVINQRTMVPLRFIIDTLGLKVQWEPETETIEIESE